jgi:hypothetical protein
MSETAQRSPWRQTPSKGGGGDFEVPPADNHLARLVAMVDLGTHTRTYGTDSKDQHQVYLAWELLGVTMSGSTFPHVIGERYTLSLNEKAKLTPVVKVLLGKDYREDGDNDLDKMLGRPCMVEVAHVPGKENRVYANVANVSSVPAALAKHGVPKAERGPLLWSLGDDLDVLEKADWLPWCYGERLHEVVGCCRELAGRQAPREGRQPAMAGGGPAGRPAPDEDIPF